MGPHLEVAAKGSRAHIGYGCNIVQPDVLPEVRHNVFVHPAHPLGF